MSLRISLSAKIACCLLCLATAACGFTPVYGKKSAAQQSAALAGVRIDFPSREATDQQLRYALEDKLNPQGAVPANPVYYLNPALVITETAIGVARDGTVSRYNVILESPYRLYRVSDDKEVAAGSVRHISSYNNLVGAYYSTYISREDAIKRGVGELAELYKQRLAPVLLSEPKVTAPAP